MCCQRTGVPSRGTPGPPCNAAQLRQAVEAVQRRLLAATEPLRLVQPFGGDSFLATLDHSSLIDSLSAFLLSASCLSWSFDHHAKHVSPIMNAETSPFCSSG